MAFCSKCGNELSGNTRFCGKCGKDQTASQALCTKCGEELDENEKFCSACGTAVVGIVDPKPEVQKPAEPEAEKKKELTKEGRKIISGSPKSEENKQAPQPPPPSVNKPREKKKRSFLGCLGKSLLILFAILFVGVVIIWNLPEDEEFEPTDLDIPGIVDIEPEADRKSDESNISPKKKITVLDAKDENAADKYRHGIELEADQYKAFELYEKLAKKGDLNAMIELSDYYEQGIWVKKDTKKAKKLLQKAADKGSEPAKWQLEFLDSEK